MEFYTQDFDLISPIVLDHQHGKPFGFDHLLNALSATQMDSFVLFYRGVLGLGSEQIFDLSDPNGLIRSQSMVSKYPDISIRGETNDFTKFRLLLSSSVEGDNTLVGKFVRESGGSGVHCISFATDDIFALVEATFRCEK